ncbi:hypothetical protein HFO56_01050 [Rhizobium laguerreae]|uniref:hypothetical protein n=1 Tax=Rhizobium laguerreae TaxID=1076926 RepID=UPI001C91F253|nr:hypothetical protein [Rhizobium laguerreae]MBY3151018.1 hypothetical protein [Rhizobium laguerreae]
MPYTYEIPYSKLADVMKRRKRVAKKNAASGLPVPVVEVVSRSERKMTVRDALARMRGAATNSREIRVATAIIEVSGFTAEVGDWKVSGFRWGGTTVTANGRMGWAANSPEVPPSIAARQELECDHCRAIRNRTSSYVVERVDGSATPLEVGATCMASFLGDASNERVLGGLADNALLLEEISRLAGSNFLESGDDVIDEIETVMAVAVSVIARDGFISSKEAFAGEPATWTTVYEEVRRYRSGDLDESAVAVTLSDFMQAGIVAEWLRKTVADGQAGPFLEKCADVFDKGISNPQDVAVLTALVGSHGRHLAQQERIATEQDVARGSKHVGIPGSRSNFVCAVQSIRPYQSRFGPAAVVTMTDLGGNLLLWFSSGSEHGGLRVGRTYEIVGTVNKHEYAGQGGYRGAEQTLLNRIKVIQDFGETVKPVAVNEEEAKESREFDELIGFLAPSRI